MFIPTLLRVEFIKSSHIAALGSRAPSLREQWPRRESASQGRQNPSDDLGLIEPLIGKPSLTVLWKVCPSDRHRGGGHPPTPATPPCVRIRTRRFDWLR